MLQTSISHIKRIVPAEQDNSKSEVKSQSRRNILREFGLNTSTHGVPGIARSETWPNRVYWTVITVVFTGIMVYFVAESISNYLDYPTQTVVSIEELSDPLFPAVSLCNYSPLRYDRFIGPFLNYSRHFNLTKDPNATTFTVEHVPHLASFFRYKLINNESLIDYFYSLDSMLLSCTYNERNCSSQDFISFNTSKFGQCYTFNARSKHINNGQLHTMFEYGGEGVLELELYIHRHQYVPYVSKGRSAKTANKSVKTMSPLAVGAVLSMHDHRQMPAMMYTVHYLRPGERHRISYTMKTSYRLGKAYSTCKNEIPPTLQAAFDQFSSAEYDYGQLTCYFSCTQKYM